jgi:hypothetical protein
VLAEPVFEGAAVADKIREMLIFGATVEDAVK